MEKEINILIVHYNTPLLTECLIKSINKFVPESKIYIFDNSDKFPFTYRQDNIIYFDNTKGQIIDFEKWLNGIKTKVSTVNKWASAKHCYTIEKCMELIPDGFVLLDSDTLLKKDITELYNNEYIYVADIEKWMGNERVIPYCCYINVPLCKKESIHYYNEKYIVGLTKNCKYDTGAWFFLESKKLNSKKIKYKDYVEHMDDGSQKYNAKSKQNEFLEKNKKLYTDSSIVIKVTKNDDMSDNYREQIKNIGKKIGLSINLDNPKTIQDKINWLKLYDSTPLKTKCADKIKIHDYCKEKIGKDICIPILKIYNKTSEIKWDELPDKFVIKCNHGSGMNIIVKDKKTLDKTKTVNQLDKWMKTDFAFQNGCELQYHNIERKIFVEEYKEDVNQKNSLYDYKFWCFNGEPKMYTINNGLGHGSINHYSMKNEFLDWVQRTDYPANKSAYNAVPKNFDLMVEYSKKLSKDFKFVRVDFYEISGELYLGELTFTPGSGFFKYKDGKTSEIIGSWLNLGTVNTETKNKKVVYTCISGKYDNLIEPEYVNKDFDYICFTDQPFVSKVWKIKPIPKELNDLTQVKKQRNIKINAHKYLSEYDFSIWVDANVSIKNDINEFIRKNCNDDAVFYVGQHPHRNCIYEEAKECVRQKKDVSANVDKQIQKYKNENFPQNYGLGQTCILFRKHNDEGCKKLMNTWWEEVKNGSHRDQLSCSYALWKNSDVKIKYLEKQIFDCKYFKWNCAHRKPIFLHNESVIKPLIEKKKIDIQIKVVNKENILKKESNLKDKIKEIKVAKPKKEPLKNSSMNYY